MNVEVDGGLANAPQTISFGSSANNILNSSGNINFGEAGNFAASNITTLSSQFVFSGPVIGDPTLSETTIPDRLAVNGEAFFHGQISTLLAASVSYKPSNPAGTVSATAVMMGLGSTCTFTPGLTGKVRVTICGTWYTTTVVARYFPGDTEPERLRPTALR